MSHTETATAQLNGVNVAALLGAREALEQAPEAAEFTWKATSEWKDGVHTRMTMDGFFGLGENQARSRSFTIDTDHPACFAATDKAPTPVEVALSGLAGCLTAGVATVAENRGIKLRSVTATIEGDMSLFGILGIDSNTRNGFRAVRVNFHVDADASDEDIRALVAQSQKRSAVFDLFTNPTNVFVTVD
ncbi:OsmC family protein [Gimibacter soli]|uniref:OsmC family protein n=1 Tax=Gimibacter soli TaxID=3024400 RepID=A0AAF0BLC4_9PROT|nr:OsmC family protein [Gimibacter soli]WCL53295.1 OsmC family protein [Gimibacter soli]